MTTDTIAAGEIREQHTDTLDLLDIKPLESDFPWIKGMRFLGGSHDPVIHIKSNSSDWSYTRFTPAEARDFARAIMAAADWAERQGG